MECSLHTLQSVTFCNTQLYYRPWFSSSLSSCHVTSLVQVWGSCRIAPGGDAVSTHLENFLLTLCTKDNLLAAEVDGIPVGALINTGAHICSRLRKVLTLALSHVHVAYGGASAVTGMCTAQVIIADHTATVLFFIPDKCPHDIILGVISFQTIPHYSTVQWVFFALSSHFPLTTVPLHPSAYTLMSTIACRLKHLLMSLCLQHACTRQTQHCCARP